MFCYTFMIWKSSATPRARREAIKMELLKLTTMRWKQCFHMLRARGGQTFPKSTEIRNSVAFRAVFSVFFRPCFSVVAESVSEQLLPRTGGLGGQFWLSKESVSTSATDCRIPTPICTKYGLQKVRTCKIDGLYR